jgi:hypothetical protein
MMWGCPDHGQVKVQEQDNPMDRAVDCEIFVWVSAHFRETKTSRHVTLTGAILFGVNTAIPGFRIRLPHPSFGHNSEYLLLLDSSASSASSSKEDADRCFGRCFFELPPNRAWIASACSRLGGTGSLDCDSDMRTSARVVTKVSTTNTNVHRKAKYNT